MFFLISNMFSAQPQCCVTVSWIELQILLSYCLIHITIIITRYILYSVYLCPCLCLCLFRSYLCKIFFIFSLIFIVTDNASSFKETYLFFGTFFRMSPIIFGCSNSKCSVSGCCLAFVWFFANFSLALLIVVLLIKKACTWFDSFV